MRRCPRPLFPLVPFLIALVLAGCSDDPQDPGQGGGPLVTIELGEYFQLAFADEGIVFVSDAAGEVLDVATWSGPSTLELDPHGARPDSVAVTFVRGTTHVDLSTEIGIPAGTVMSFDGGWASQPTGEAELTFTNVPAHDNYLIGSSLATLRPPMPFPAQHTIQVHWDAVDVFVRIDPVGGWPLGCWTRDLRADEARTLDLAGLLVPLVRHATRLPGGADRVTARLSYHVREGVQAQAFSLSMDSYYAGAIPDSAVMFGPDIDPDRLSCSFYHTTGSDPSVFFSLEAQGAVPTDFTEMPGTLAVASSDPDSAVFTMAGAWDRFETAWYRDAIPPADWYVEGRAPLNSFALPQVPPEVLALVPGLAGEQFVLHYLRVEDDPEPGVTLARGFFFSLVRRTGSADAGEQHVRPLPLSRRRPSAAACPALAGARSRR